MYRAGLIGTGSMGTSMLGAWIESGTLRPEDILVAERDAGKAEAARDLFGVAIGGVSEIGAECEIVILAVKPQDSQPVLSELTGVLKSSQTLMSIVAGLTVGAIRRQLGEGLSVVRIMPNMAARVRAAVSVFTVDAGAEEPDTIGIKNLLAAMGELEEVEEKWMDLATAMSGSGPAYYFYLTEALENACVAQGMPKEMARKLARETLWGAARMIKETGIDPKELRRAVSSPGGTTLAALSEMEKAGFAEIVVKAVEAARRRAGELAQE